MAIHKVTSLAIAAVLLFGGGYAVRWVTAKPPTSNQDRIPGTSNYPLLAKRLFIENPNDHIINFAILRQQLKTYMADNSLDGSLYFEYLPTGTSVRIEGDELRLAASLIKLPAAMDLYRAAELGKLSLDTQVTLQESWLDAGYGNLYKKGAGYQLTLRQAAKIMLTDSDNTALKAIGSTLGDMLDLEDRAINAVDADISQNPDLSVSIGARSYSSFLKCLYFSCYLSQQDSQELLHYLTDTGFNDRLTAGVADKSIKIAHKIGVANTTTQSDCGVVYVPNRNYLLCVMIDGPDSGQTNSHIAAISKTVYDFVTTR